MLKLRSRPHRDEPPVDEITCLEIVAGPRTGARISIEDARPLSIGHAFDDDVVIRHPSVNGVRAMLSRDDEGIRLQVEAGTVLLLGVPVQAGRSARLPRWVPFAIGDSVLAVGPERGGGWDECRRLARRLAAERDGAQALVGAAASPPEVPARTAARWWRVPALLAIPGAIGLVALLAWPAPPGAERVADPQAARRLRALLADEGLSHLKLGPAAQGGVLLQGLVDRETDRVRLSDRLTQAGIAVRLDLGTGEQLARQVGDVLRLNGVAAQVRHLGRGVVEARFADPGAPRRAQIEAAVRRDVPGLAGLVIETSPAPEAPARAAPVPADAGKRVVNVVYGPRGYVVTADGSRYFEGAFLPSGHRIVRISDDEVRIERDGKTTRLSL
jgi:type III secretion protein D